VNMTPTDVVKSLFEVTGDKNDVLLNNDLKDIYQENRDVFDNFQHLKKILLGMGAEKYHKIHRGLKGLRRRWENGEEEVEDI